MNEGSWDMASAAMDKIPSKKKVALYLIIKIDAKYSWLNPAVFLSSGQKNIKYSITQPHNHSHFTFLLESKIMNEGSWDMARAAMVMSKQKSWLFIL